MKAALYTKTFLNVKRRYIAQNRMSYAVKKKEYQQSRYIYTCITSWCVYINSAMSPRCRNGSELHKM